MFNELSTDFNICIDTFYILNMTLFKQSIFAVKWAELVNRPVKSVGCSSNPEMALKLFLKYFSPTN